MRKQLSILILAIGTSVGVSQAQTLDLSEADSVGSATTPLSQVTQDSYFWLINQGASAAPLSRRVSLYQLPNLLNIPTYSAGEGLTFADGNFNLGGEITGDVVFTGTGNFLFPESILGTNIGLFDTPFINGYINSLTGADINTDEIYANTLDNIIVHDNLDFENAAGLINVIDPTNPQDVATKAYVDANVGESLGNLIISSDTLSSTVTDGDIVFKTEGDGRVLFPGTGAGSIRIGEIAEGPNGNVGSGSIAIGSGSVASHNAVNSISLGYFAGVGSADNAVAIGPGANATQNNSIALGNAKANAITSVSIGQGAEAWAVNAIAIGTEAGDNVAGTDGIGSVTLGNEANSNPGQDIGNQSVAIGQEAISSEDNTIALGYGAEAEAADAVAIGNNAGDATGTMGTGSITIGSGANTGLDIGGNSIAIGTNSSTPKNRSVAIGYQAGNTSGSTNASSITIGDNANSGFGNIGSHSIALGSSTQSRGEGSLSIGRGITTTSTGSLMMGYHSAGSVQINSLANSFELAWDGNTAFKVGSTYGTGITSNADPDINLSDAVDGVIAYDNTDHEFRARVNGNWESLRGEASQGVMNKLNVSDGTGGWSDTNITIASGSTLQTSSILTLASLFADVRIEALGGVDDDVILTTNNNISLDFEGQIDLGLEARTGTVRTLAAQGIGTDIDIVLSPKGAGTIKTPIDYGANISSSEDLITKGYFESNLPSATTLGTTNQIPFMNIASNDYSYSSNMVFEDGIFKTPALHSLGGGSLQLLADEGVNMTGTEMSLSASDEFQIDGGSELIITSEDLEVNTSGDLRLTSGDDVMIQGLRYPTADGTAGQILTTNGAGTLSFQDGLLAGSATQIPVSNTDGTGFSYSSALVFNGTDLFVDGKVTSEEIVVEVVNGPDYVFETDYELRSIEETEKFIKEHKHLPEIPSAKEMEANGVGMSEMSMLLLKKVEELTLYTIEQQKLLKQQAEENKALIERIEKLEAERK